MASREQRPRSLSRWPTVGLLMTVGLSMVMAATPASAHFLLNLNVRILHVEHLADGLRVYLRTPMPYLVADRVGPVGANGLPEPAPYTSNRMEDGRLVHYLEPSALRSDPDGLGRLAAEGFQLRRDGERLEATVERVRAYPIGTQPPFATLDEARAAFETQIVFPADVERAYVGDVVVDIILRYRTGGPVYDYSVSSSLDPGLPDQENTANLILDYSPGATRVFRARGLLGEPIEVSRSAWSAIFTFIKEGVRHILEGYDHVLFIICLTLGATRLTSLVWRATGFTIGHSVALIAGLLRLRSQWSVVHSDRGDGYRVVDHLCGSVSRNVASKRASRRGSDALYHHGHRPAARLRIFLRPAQATEGGFARHLAEFACIQRGRRNRTALDHFGRVDGLSLHCANERPGMAA